jgi:ankyrin repeat protein
MGGSDRNESEPPSYDDAGSQSSSTYPVLRPKVNLAGDRKDVKAPLPTFSKPVHAPKATLGDAEFIRAVWDGNGIPALERFSLSIDNVDARDAEIGTALQVAVSGQRIDVVQWLLEKGVNPNMEGGTRGTALKRAVETGNRAIVNLLLDYGANPNIEERNFYYGCALELALTRPALFDLLLSRGANPDSPGVLSTAIKSRRPWAVEKLLAAGADVEATWNAQYYSPLNDAVWSGDQAILRLLLAYGADPNARPDGHTSFTPLTVALLVDRFDQIPILIQYGANPYDGLLQQVARRGSTNTLKFLVEHIGVDINNQFPPDGYTALMEAARSGREDTLKYLLSHQADVNIRTQGGFSALNTAVDLMHAGCVRLLLEAGANTGEDRLLERAVSVGSFTIIKLLVDAGADVNARSTISGRTPLESAAQEGKADMITYLVSQGADVNGGKSTSKTPLMHAIDYQHSSSVKMLLRLGASTSGADFLSHAASSGSIAVLQELLASGMDSNMRDSKGRTAVEVAREKGYKDVVDFLMGFDVKSDIQSSESAYSAAQIEK